MNARVVNALLIALALAGCRGDRAVAPAPATPRFSSARDSTGNIGQVQATVYGPGGQPAAGYVVTVVNRDMGPFRLDGVRTSYSGTVTGANGTTTIGSLPVPGDYCVLARPLTSVGTATGRFTFYAPLPVNGSTMPTPPATGLGVIAATATGSSVPLSGASFQQYCFSTSAQAAPLSLSPGSFHANVRLDLAPGGTLTVQYLDLAGQPVADPAWVLEDLLPPPWMQDFTLPPGLRPGVLLSAAPPGPSGTVLTGIPNAPVVVESGILNDGSQGQLTSTLRLTPTGGTQALAPILLEPLLCTLNRHAEAAGDAGAGVDFLGPVKDGYRASFGPPLERRRDAAIWYAETGSGTATLRLKLTTASGTLDLVATYSVQGTNARLSSESGTAWAAGVRAMPYFAPLPGGGLRVTWLLTGLPEGTTALGYRLSGSVDHFPDTGGDFQTIPKPTGCTGGQGNDDQWWVV